MFPTLPSTHLLNKKHRTIYSSEKIMLLVNRPYKKDWLISKWMRHRTVLARLPTRTGPGWAGWDSRGRGHERVCPGLAPQPHSYGSQAQQPTARVQDPFPLRVPPTSALPAPKLDTTTLDIRLSGLLVQHDLGVTPLSLPQAHALGAGPA